MGNSITSILILAGIAVFLILKLMNVLGTREGFEKAPDQSSAPTPAGGKPVLRVVEPEDDRDITDHAELSSPTGRALLSMKRIEPAFSINDFLPGARSAYEMILMGFERGEIEPLKPFLSDEVYASFEHVVNDRASRGETIVAQFVGVSGLELKSAEFDEATQEAELTIAFRGELTSELHNAEGEVIAGDATKIITQKDVWTFARVMGSDDPNWRLVATGG